MFVTLFAGQQLGFSAAVRKPAVAALVGAALALTACNKAPSEAPVAAEPAPAAAPSPAVAAAALPADASPVAAAAAPTPVQLADSPRLQAMIDVVTAYAAVRQALAADNLADAKAKAPALADKSKAALTTLAGGPVGQELPALAAAADAIAAAADIRGARFAFGDASKALITALAAEPTMQTGIVVYRCPMAKTYQKWVQTGDDMGNPYWGAEMLTCGAKVPIKP